MNFPDPLIIPMAVIATLTVLAIGLAIRFQTKTEEYAQLRKNSLATVLQHPEKYWVWQLSGYDEGNKYSYLYGVEVKTQTEYRLALTHEFSEAMAALRSHAVVVHNGPPGTTG